MRARLILAANLLACFAALAAGAVAAPVSYDPPAETATLPPGPNLETAQANCSACHSADYITTQPRSFKDPHAFWAAEVAKMRKAYGAQIKDEDAPKIVDYLTATMGK
ncbi:SorB family sulfite dehydrogenase c-type cytochrome subunit [Phenylobacterium montanum]|uniref:Cytochrome c n=1 Tax=Phenylobacterium montanum TaxID=2823693 RepID=A0A975FVZ7_9CAUL|nr:cytochrome c [Caulobacter sp. S6]QUD86320.1 cytochrome c [Caulobacter sp. S6]